MICELYRLSIERNSYEDHHRRSNPCRSLDLLPPLKGLPVRMSTLPPEIWAMILSPMDRRDIFNMALVSRPFRDSVRRILAQSVVLGGEEGPGYQEYIDHLRKHGLLPLTKKLVVKTVHLNAIPWLQMPNLLSFTLAPTCTDEFQCPKDWMSKLNTFITTLASHKLEEITVLSEFPVKGRRLVIPNIKRVTWNDGGMYRARLCESPD